MNKLSDLKPDTRNANKGTKRGAALVRSSLEQYGAGRSILIDKNDRIIAGNKTTENAIAAGMTDVIIVDSDGTKIIAVRRTDLDLENDPKAKQLAIADNRAGELSLEWDADTLKELAEEIDLSGLFEGDELANILLDASEEQIDSTVVADAPDLFTLEQVADKIEQDWPQPVSVEEVVAGLITPAMAMAQFNALAKGGSGGYYISALFNPHRLTTNCAGGGNYLDACSDAKFVRTGSSFLAKNTGGDTHPSLFAKYSSIGWAGQGQLVAEFRPSIARDIYKAFCAAGDKVLDPCHGWGGRAVGWLAANLGGEYVGYDPSTLTSTGWRAMVDFLKQSATTSTAVNHCMPFEDSVLEPDSFDFALTSPPYFDTEDYSSEATNSLNRYKTFDAWVTGFYEPFILKTLTALKPGSAFVLNVGNKRYPLARLAGEISARLGASTVPLDAYKIGRGAVLSASADDAFESFILIRKKS
jgi:hypothetical protein